MTTEENQNIRNLFIVRERKCLVQERAYDIWLSRLNPIRWSSIIIGVIMPAVASVGIFSSINQGDWEFTSTLLLLISGIVSGLHAALKCDAHQVECLRLSKRYSSLAAEYESSIFSGETTAANRERLDKEFKQLNEETLTTPPYWCIRKAEKQIDGKKYNS